MKINLLHNKIIKDNVTDAFIESFNSALLPALTEKYGDSLTEVQMYEDYLGDDFVCDGEFFYPLTLVFADGTRREWIKWKISEKKKFSLSVPYAYVGRDPLEIKIAESVPTEFEEKLVGRAMYFEGGVAPLSIEASTDDKSMLIGKYSQTFIDEMNRQISREIESAFSVSGIADSGVELHLVFAPGTYMEHVQDNVTYRRLLLTARACGARDLWIKWSSVSRNLPLTVSNHADGACVKFELGEDVPQKIREKEYRFLVRSSADKYQEAMGRKNITEWRDVIKRVIKRGELVKCATAEVKPQKTIAPITSEAPEAKPEQTNELAFKLQEVLNGYKPPVSQENDTPVLTDNLSDMLRDVLGIESAQSAQEEEKTEAVSPIFDLPEIAEEISEEPATDEKEEEVNEPSEYAESSELDAYKAREEELRREIEAELRAKIELEAQEKAREEAELRRAHEELKAENERLAEAARKAEEERLASEAQRDAEAARMRAEIESRERAEEREKERMAEAARIALIEQQRLAETRAKEDAIREAEEERLRAERIKAEEEAIAAEKRVAEEERLRRELAAKEEEERARAEALEKAKKEEEAKAQEVNYVSKNARLLFRRPIDPNITKRIHEIILTTIKYFHKENVYIKIKATVPDSTTVNLHFVKIPEQEQELLVNIIKVLGKSELGITKVFLE